MPSPDAPKYVRQHMVEALAHHQLDELTPPGSPVRSFRLWSPSLGETLSTLLTFTPEGIVVQGDLRPGEHGAMSGKECDLEWFEGARTEEEVCEAFLQETWQAEVAARDLRTLTSPDPAHARALEVFASKVELSGLEDEASVRRTLIALGFSPSKYGRVGYDYPLGDAGWLCAIQRRFAALRGQEA